MIEIPLIIGTLIIVYIIKKINAICKSLNRINTENQIIFIMLDIDSLVSLQNKYNIKNSINKINVNSIIYKCNDDKSFCSLTQDIIPINEDIRVLKCDHYFTKMQIDIWLMSNNVCPVCRQFVCKLS